MAIVKMKRLRLLAMGADREKLLRLLQGMGCVEVDQADLDGEGASPELLEQLRDKVSRPDDRSLARAREGQSQAQRALAALDQFAPAKGNFLSPRPQVSQAELFDGPAALEARQAAREINDLDGRLGAIRTEEQKRTAQRAALAPWLPLDLPLETESTGQVAVQLGTLPAGVSLEEARAALKGTEGLADLSQVSADNTLRFCLLLCHNSRAEEALEALKELGWTRSSLREWTGTAAENDARLADELAALAREKEEVRKKLSAMGGLRPALKRLYDLEGVEASREESGGRLLELSQIFLLEGWVPADRWPDVERALDPYSCAWEVSDPAPEEYPQVPVELRNNTFTRPLNMVTEMYSLPAYGSLDPNPLMAPFFVLFYGVMMADMGYGLAMLALGWLLRFKKRATGTLGHMGGLMLLCGTSTLIMGAVTGGFLGDFPTQLALLLNPESTFALPALFTPLDDTLMILIGCMGLGLVQIVTGMAISFVQKLRRGQIMDAVWEEVTWWLVFAGIALTALGATDAVLILGCVMVLAGPLITGKGFGKITGIFGSLYNHVTGYFGDILSYSRLMALMLAGSVIAQVFNTLGAIPGNPVVFVVISLLGNTLNFALNLLSCYVHDLRLQCLEFFGKFYEDGGRPFQPLDLRAKYYDIVKER